ncbi:MAG: aldo/keto reductase [Geminicoccaceae bacterium]
MDYTTLGKTGLRVSVAGLGCGGSSRLGMGYGGSGAQAAEIVRKAFELGVTFFDTAEAYGTEEAVGHGLAGLERQDFVISTKSQIKKEGRLIGADELIRSLERSLERLRLDHIDIFHLHGVRPEHYEHALSLVPALERAREQGKIGHIGITETSPRDPKHLMLGRALGDAPWAVVMVAFHMLNQNTRELIFPRTRERQIGTLIMFAVRAIFSQPGRLQTVMKALAREGKIPDALADREEPLDFLVHDGGARSVIDAAYRFARHEPGVDVVLFGTGNPEHLADNIRSILSPPLPDDNVAELHRLFGALEGVGLDLPANRP